MNKTISPLVILGWILGASIVVAVGIGAFVVYQVTLSNNTLSVTGSAKQQVTADTVKWVSTLSRPAKASTLKAGYATLSRDLAEVKAFLITQGISEDQIVVTPVFMDEIYQQYQQPEKEYNLRQTIEIQSIDVAKITAVAKNISPLIDKGLLYSTSSLEYYYSKLPEARVTLLADAIKDAQARAGEIASAGGSRIGALKSASSGVVQVMSHGSTDVSDYGSYDTSKIEKDIMVTVKATFRMR